MRDYELDVNLGGARFCGKGTEASVRADYERFLKAVESLPTAQTGSGMRSVGKPWPVIKPSLDLMFEAHEDGCLSLKKTLVAPLKNPRALVVLLYGYLLIENEAVVPAAHLSLSAKRSGITVDRVDRMLQRYIDKEFVEKVGRKRGSGYRITEPGIEFAKDQIANKEWK